MKQLLILAVLACLVAGQSSNQAEVELQAAIKAEVFDGNLKAAIERYQRIITTYGSDRPVVAKALIRMGQCYEKLGTEQAREGRKAYERVVREFADQAEPARTARERLVAMGSPASASSELTIRRIWAGPRVLGSEVSPSPDGRYLSYTDWNTGDVAVHDLVTGENRRVTQNKPGDPCGWPDRSVFSRDGKQIAYNCFIEKDGMELRTIDLDGSGARVLYRGTGYPYPVDWSPDGKHILTKLGRPVLIALADGSVQDLAIENPETMCFSPDGRYIAYDAVQAKEARQHDVYVYERATQRTVPLVRHPADDRLAGWAPDGRYVLFASNRRGALDALLVAVSNGQPQGESVLVRRDLGASSGIGFTRSGAYYFAVSAGGHDIHTARLDPETGKLLSPSVEAAGSYLGSNWGPDFSRDGRFLAYVSVRGTGAEREGVIVIRSLEAEKERLLRPALAPTEIGHGLCWAPDGRSLFVDGADKAGRGGLFRIDAQTGEASFILEQRFVRDVLHLEPSPDGRSLYYTARAEDGQRGFRVMVCDLGSGKVQLLNRSTQMALALSPDGRQLAFFAAAGQGEAEGLVVMPSAGGSARLVARGADGLTIAWSPDGRYLIYPVRMKTSGANPEQRRNELWRVSPQGGDPQRLSLTVDGLLRRLRVHPDGQRIVYYARLLGSDVWVMENFLPGTK